MSKLRLCIDIDNVVAQTDVVMRRVIREYTGDRVRLEYAHIVEFDYHKCTDGNDCSIMKEEWAPIHECFSEPGNLARIEPFPGVQEQLTRLSEKYALHFATSRLPKARKSTVEWLEKHAFPPHDLHFLTHKEKHITLGNFYAAVEDHYEQAALFAEAEVPCYIVHHPWNAAKPAKDGLYWVVDWNELTSRLLS